MKVKGQGHTRKNIRNRLPLARKKQKKKTSIGNVKCSRSIFSMQFKNAYKSSDILTTFLCNSVYVACRAQFQCELDRIAHHYLFSITPVVFENTNINNIDASCVDLLSSL